jgi:transposase-like protein
MDTAVVRARRAAGVSIHSIAKDMGVSHVTVFRRQWGSRIRPKLEPTSRSYVVKKTMIGKCSTDYETVAVSLARSAANYE